MSMLSGIERFQCGTVRSSVAAHVPADNYRRVRRTGSSRARALQRSAPAEYARRGCRWRARDRLQQQRATAAQSRTMA